MAKKQLPMLGNGSRRRTPTEHKFIQEQERNSEMTRTAERYRKKKFNDQDAEAKTRKKAILHPKRVANEAKYVTKQIGKGLKKLFISND